MNEIWKQIDNYEGHYSISSFGRLRRDFKTKSTYSGRIIAFTKDAYGYYYCYLWKNGSSKKHKIHKLVTNTFFGNCPKNKQVNHKNGIKTDNRIDNLEYVSPKENTAHAIKMGLFINVVGSENGRSKLKEKDILEIRRLRQSGLSVIKITENYNISTRNIYDIVSRKTWVHI